VVPDGVGSLTMGLAPAREYGCRNPRAPKELLNQKYPQPAHREVRQEPAFKAPLWTLSRLSCRRPRCRTGLSAVMSSGRAANARLRNPQWMAIETSPRVEREDPEGTALQAASSTRSFHEVMSAPGWIRTSDPGLRRAVRFRCATRAWCGRRDSNSLSTKATGLQPAPPHRRWRARGVTERN
jgi:hypothetical protein